MMKEDHEVELQRESRVAADMAARLERIRTMRDVLLANHQTTEMQLTDEAVKCQALVDTMGRDIAELHSHIDHRRRVALRHERAVDTFAEAFRQQMGSLQVRCRRRCQ